MKSSYYDSLHFKIKVTFHKIRGLKVIFTLLARTCVHYIALTKRFPVS